MIILEQLTKLNIKRADAQTYLNGLNATVERYEINSPLRLSHFIGQLMHESALFTTVTENLNYTPSALLRTFNTPTIIRFTAQTANLLGRTDKQRANREMIANIAYANRMGNGPRESGDGWRFRGRGLIQITGRVNYADVGKAIGIDCLNNPDLLVLPLYACLSAGHYWNSRKLNALADADDLTGITKRINGGVNGLAERKIYVERCKTVFV